eukprot:scaffold2564_cov69-Skeletonema_dohrnii-CCMP3373.AAC.3
MWLCGGCGLDSIDIDVNSIPPNLSVLSMCHNNINADGCRELAKLLQGETVTLRELYLDENKIDDEGVGILVDALQNNTSLEYLNLENNGGITNNGLKLLLKLVNDVSSINSTLQSNHTLQTSGLSALNKDSAPNEIEKQIRHALAINQENADDSAAAGREKVISTQLNSLTRKELCCQQGIDECNFYSQINDLHLPEVLSLVARTHGVSAISNNVTSEKGIWSNKLPSTQMKLFIMQQFQLSMQQLLLSMQTELRECEQS